MGQPSGEQYRIEADGYAADIVEVGGALRALTGAGRPLVRGWETDRMMPVYSGALLQPWPNRIGDGAYTFDGVEAQASLNEVAPRWNALHGLVVWVPWRLVDRSGDRLVLAYALHPSPAYPWRLDCTATYAVGSDGLSWTLAARNAGDSPAPYGVSVHPYVSAGDGGRVDGWTLDLPADAYLEVDDARLLPVEVRPVEGTPYDFRGGRRIGGTEVDHAFTEVRYAAAGTATARVLGDDGSGTAVTWDRGCPWVQVHTADRPEPELNRTGLALEPMTCPPDAFRTGTDLVVLQPGEEHAVTFRFARVEG